jgi:hypothetical protein
MFCKKSSGFYNLCELRLHSAIIKSVFCCSFAYLGTVWSSIPGCWIQETTLLSPFIVLSGCSCILLTCKLRQINLSRSDYERAQILSSDYRCSFCSGRPSSGSLRAGRGVLRLFKPRSSSPMDSLWSLFLDNPRSSQNHRIQLPKGQSFTSVCSRGNKAYNSDYVIMCLSRDR